MNIKDYRYVVVGAGFFSATIAERIANDLKAAVLVIEKRPHLGGNAYSKVDLATGIEEHLYGTHVFHTSDELVWQYINNFTKFNNYRHKAVALVCGKSRAEINACGV